jgi:WD40-like Beta Propeller Repeat
MRSAFRSSLPFFLAAAIAGFGAACGSNDGGDDPTPVSLTIEPADAVVTVLNGAAVTQPYTAKVTYTDGNVVDVTQSARFEIRDAQYGSFNRAQLEIGGGGAGPTRVLAFVDTLSGETGLTVLVKKTIVDPGLPPTTPDMFDSATEDPALAPTLRYPLDKILVPPNIGQFDVHWNGAATTNVFQLRMRNEYIDVRRYTNGLTAPLNEPYWTQFEPSEWFPIASTKTQLSLELSAMNSADPTRKGSAANQAVDVTNENARGGIYYWAIYDANRAGIVRYDVEKPETAPAPLFETGTEPGGAGKCHGCHTLSTDGTKLAMTLSGGDGEGVVIDVASRTQLVPVSAGLKWNFATFTPDASKLITVLGGQMKVREATGGAELGILANSAADRFPSHPELSPDGTQLVNSECTGTNNAFAPNCGLVIRPFDLATNTGGAIQPLVPFVAGGLKSFYPSFSPDGKWVVFTRSPGADSYNEPDAETWVVKADGSLPPVKLAIPDLGQAGRTNSWARWVPFAQSFGPSNEQMFYLTFSSMRPYGVRIPAGGKPQIWMAPFFPARAMLGMDPSGPAFRVPFQSTLAGNHIAQWTQAVVVIE